MPTDTAPELLCDSPATNQDLKAKTLYFSRILQLETKLRRGSLGSGFGDRASLSNVKGCPPVLPTNRQRSLPLQALRYRAVTLLTVTNCN